MSSTNRRSLFNPPKRLATAAGADAESTIPAQSRRAFLQASAGAAAGVAVISTGPKLAAAALHGPSNTAALGEITKPSGPPPRETVMAYVRDASRGEVTVLSGTRETTYRDPALVKRMIDAGR
jgi:hypothetical protein